MDLIGIEPMLGGVLICLTRPVCNNSRSVDVGCVPRKDNSRREVNRNRPGEITQRRWIGCWRR